MLYSAARTRNTWSHRPVCLSSQHPAALRAALVCLTVGLLVASAGTWTTEPAGRQHTGHSTHITRNPRLGIAWSSLVPTHCSQTCGQCVAGAWPVTALRCCRYAYQLHNSMAENCPLLVWEDPCLAVALWLGYHPCALHLAPLHPSPLPYESGLVRLLCWPCLTLRLVIMRSAWCCHSLLWFHAAWVSHQECSVIGHEEGLDLLLGGLVNVCKTQWEIQP